VVLRFPAHKAAPVQHVALDQDLNRMVTASLEDLKIWDLCRLTCLQSYRLPFRVCTPCCPLFWQESRICNPVRIILDGIILGLTFHDISQE
jgi:hypothetical protein